MSKAHNISNIFHIALELTGQCASSYAAAIGVVLGNASLQYLRSYSLHVWSLAVPSFPNYHVVFSPTRRRRLTVQLTGADELVAASSTVINELRSSTASSSEWETRTR